MEWRKSTGCAERVVLVLSTLIITLWYLYVHQGKTGQESPFWATFSDPTSCCRFSLGHCSNYSTCVNVWLPLPLALTPWSQGALQTEKAPSLWVILALPISTKDQLSVLGWFYFSNAWFLLLHNGCVSWKDFTKMLSITNNIVTVENTFVSE